MQVADASVIWEPSTVRRRNRLKTVTVSSELEPGAIASDVVTPLRTWLDAEQTGWPPGYRYEFGGEEETSARANRSIVEQLPIAGLIIPLLLIGQFNSIRRTAIILLTIPLGLIGVVAGLILARSYLGFMTLLGVIALAGIIINNAIVLIDRIRIEIEDNGLEPPRAIVEAAMGRVPPHSADHRHHRRRAVATVVRRRPDVGAHGDRHHLRAAWCDGPDSGRRADPLFAVLPRPLRPVPHLTTDVPVRGTRPPTEGDYTGETMNKPEWRRFLLIVGATVLAAACGGGSDVPSVSPAPAPTPTPTPPTPEPELLLPDDASAVILEVWIEGGLAPLEYTLGQPPVYWLTAGRALYLEGPGGSPPAHPSTDRSGIRHPPDRRKR